MSELSKHVGIQNLCSTIIMLILRTLERFYSTGFMGHAVALPKKGDVDAAASPLQSFSVCLESSRVRLFNSKTALRAQNGQKSMNLAKQEKSANLGLCFLASALLGFLGVFGPKPTPFWGAAFIVVSGSAFVVERAGAVDLRSRATSPISGTLNWEALSRLKTLVAWFLPKWTKYCWSVIFLRV